jgi:hypothetical protein
VCGSDGETSRYDSNFEKSLENRVKIAIKKSLVFIRELKSVCKTAQLLF